MVRTAARIWLMLLVGLRPHASFKLNPADADAAGVIGAGTLSLQQSFGFLEYTDEQWARLQSIYLSQSSRQRGYPHSEPSLFWTKNWHSTLSCAFERRLGNKGDGGKWVCDAYRLAAQKECNVISVGSDNEWSFEIAIHQLNPRCKIYTFDYSRNPIGKPDFVTYLSFGLGAHNMSCAGLIFNTSPYTPICRHTDGLWEELLTLSSAVKMIGLEGKTIDILKMDCEGCEYVVLSELDQVFCQQVLVEVHKFEVVPVAPIEDMMQNNYVIFHREPNLLTRGNDMEFSFIKLHPQFTKHMHGDQHPSVAILFDGNIGLFCKYNSSGWIVSMELHAWIRGLMPACQYIVMVEELSVDGGGEGGSEGQAAGKNKWEQLVSLQDGASSAHVTAVFANPRLNDLHQHRFLVHVVDTHPGLTSEEAELAVRERTLQAEFIEANAEDALLVSGFVEKECSRNARALGSCAMRHSCLLS